MNKVSKNKANYRPKDKAYEKCHNCFSMDDDGHCQKVSGIVEPEYVCDLWTGPKKIR